jgi:hypothetical protein
LQCRHAVLGVGNESATDRTGQSRRDPIWPKSEFD